MTYFPFLSAAVMVMMMVRLRLLILLRIERMTSMVEVTWRAREFAARHHRSHRRRNAMSRMNGCLSRFPSLGVDPFDDSWCVRKSGRTNTKTHNSLRMLFVGTRPKKPTAYQRQDLKSLCLLCNV